MRRLSTSCSSVQAPADPAFRGRVALGCLSAIRRAFCPTEPRYARPPLLIADGSVEGEELASLLRTKGYHVVDVPIALLDAHVLTREPRVLVCSTSDQPRAVALAERVMQSPAGARLVLFCVGDPLRAEEIFRHSPATHTWSENVFERPGRTLGMVSVERHHVRSPRPREGDYVARGTVRCRRCYARHSIAPLVSDSSPPASEIAAPGDPLDLEAILPVLDDSMGLANLDSLSPELRAILDAAEARVVANAEKMIAGPPSSDEDADCPVPADMLSPLDEPLDALDDSPGTGSGVEGSHAAFGQPSSAAAGGASPSQAAPFAFSESAHPPAGNPTTSQPIILRPPMRLDDPGDSMPPSSGGSSLPSLAGYPFSMMGPANVGISGPSSEILALRRELGALGQRSPAAQSVDGTGLESSPPPLDPADAPVRFQEPRPLVEGRSAIARAHEDRLRGEPPSEARVSETARPPGTSASPMADVRGGATSVLSSGFLTELQRPGYPMSAPASPREPLTRKQEEAVPSTAAEAARGRPPTSVTDTSSRIRSATGPLEPMRYPSPPVGDTSRGRDAIDGGRAPITAGSGKATSDPGIPIVYGELEGARPLARGIGSRFTGILVLVAAGTSRRVVLHDGDVVTSASDRAEESLVGFLAERGDASTRDVVPKLQARLPASGRHAGAALIAQGYLAQDDLWPVLRAHAEWIIGKAIAMGPGAVEVDDDPPARLKAEPSVFGGATGAEVFVEIVRRVVPVAVALVHLGGAAARLDKGARASLLGECALSEAEQAVVRSAPGRTVGELCAEGEGDLAPVLWATVELGVLGVLAAARASAEARSPEVDPIDDDAVRSKVRARTALVREGDYFSLLGIPRSATAYEIKRAYLELRRAFEPARLLTAKTVDLLDDVELSLEVVDEAYDILRDTNRRERYRRAIEASPVA